MSDSEVSSANRVPSSMTQIGTTVKYEFLNYLRSRRFFILLGLWIAVSIILAALIGYRRPSSFLDTSLDFYGNWWGPWVPYVVILSGIFFGGDAISGEFQNKTGYFLVPNPVRRSSIYIGKWLAAFIASSIVMGVFALIMLGNEIYYFGANQPYQFGESLLFAWVYLAAVLGFTFLFSSLFKTSAISILITAILFLFAFSIINFVIEDFAQIEPWFVLTYGAGIIGNILTVPYPAHTSTVPTGPRGPVVTLYNVTVPEGLAIMGGYFIVTAILGLLLFEIKEFN